MMRLVLWVLIAVLSLGAIASPTAGATVCASSSVSIDTSLAHGFGGTLIGSVGQTFVTADTLMTSLTVWGAGENSYRDVIAYVVATDSSGTPASTPLWTGETLRLPEPGPKPFTWTMDPPLVLPSSGRYAWFVCSVLVDLMAVQGADVYADGTMWGTCRTGCSGTIQCLDAYASDFAFRVTFCANAPTPVRRQTWGRLKSIYR